MNRTFTTTLAVAVLATVLVACGGNKKEPVPAPHVQAIVSLKGDSTVYGLVCEGCTDSVLVLLPSDESDPVKYDIIDATQQHQVFGKLRIGDRVALMPDPNDARVATFVVNLDDLKGTWAYEVMPQLRDFATMSKRMQRRMMQNMPDSVKQTFLVPRNYGFTLKRDNSASPVGFVPQGNALEDESPVVYPSVPFYCEWHLWNGRLLLVRNVGKGGFGGTVRRQDVRVDTTRLLLLTDDSLALQFADHVQGYRSHSNAMDVNQKARTIATRQARQALRDAQ